MIRRKFLGLVATILVIGVAGMFSFNSSFIRKIYYKIRNRLNPASAPKPDSEREEASLPEEGVEISVETALNSRCTSDHDDNPHFFHWGMFDKNKKLTASQIEQIIKCAKIPRFTDSAIEIKQEIKTLTFLIDGRLSAIQRDWTMVESGMQQQAIGLVCAALGAGYTFNDFGMDGKSLSDLQFATIRIKLDPLKPSYNGSCWSSSAPKGTQSWKSGTLPDPIRQGKKPLISTLAKLKTENSIGEQTHINDLGQLLWAARGRTPHYHISDPWGMTIPTYHGKEDISDVFVITDGNLSKYINWKNNRPTHSLEIIRQINEDATKLFASRYKSGNCFIVLAKNKNEAKANWEIGYQLLNLMLQAQSLGVSYSARLLDESQKKLFQTSGIKEPVAILLLKKN